MKQKTHIWKKEKMRKQENELTKKNNRARSIINSRIRLSNAKTPEEKTKWQEILRTQLDKQDKQFRA